MDLHISKLVKEDETDPVEFGTFMGSLQPHLFPWVSRGEQGRRGHGRAVHIHVEGRSRGPRGRGSLRAPSAKRAHCADEEMSCGAKRVAMWKRLRARQRELEAFGEVDEDDFTGAFDVVDENVPDATASRTGRKVS